MPAKGLLAEAGVSVLRTEPILDQVFPRTASWDAGVNTVHGSKVTEVE